MVSPRELLPETELARAEEPVMVDSKRGAVARAIGASVAVAVFAANGPAQELLAEHANQRGFAGSNDEYGSAVARLGDVDGDGVGDLLIASSGEDDGNFPWDADRFGAVRVISGASGAVLREHLGTEQGGQLGLALAGGSDFDGDGVPDYAFGSWFLPGTGTSEEGIVWAHSGATGALLHTWMGERRFDLFGWRLRIVGDVDGDGVDDVGIGAPGFDLGGGQADAGKAYLFSGATGTLIRDFVGGAGGEELGLVCGIGDVDGDGRDDVLVGAHGAAAGPRGQGQIRVHSGATGALIYSRNGERRGDRFGLNACALGDVDGDGVPDFAVAAPGYDVVDSEGRIYLVSGRAGVKLGTIDGTHVGEGFGGAGLDGGADFDGDGVRDLAAGTLYATGAGLASAARIHSTVHGRLLYELRGASSPGGATEFLGSSIAALGDFDGDGIDDLLVGARNHSGTTTALEGRAYVFGGNDLLLQLTPEEAAPGETVVADLRAGGAGRLGLIALVAISGVPRFDPLLLAPFDAFGELQLSAKLPAAVSGLDFTFKGFGQSRTGRGPAMESLEVTLTVR